MPTAGIHHVDLAVAHVPRSLAFYRDLLAPLGWDEEVTYPTYRGTEEVVYLVRTGVRNGGIGLRQADGGEHRYYDVGIEHLAFEVEGRDEVDEAHARCLARARRSTSRPRRIATSPATTRSSSSTPTGSGSRCSAGRPTRRGAGASPARAQRKARSDELLG